MGRYATPGRCLDCQAELGTAAVCPQCGLMQTSPAANVLRWHLLEAERALAAARQPAPDPQAQWRPPAPQRPSAPRAARASPSTSTVLLGLGAVCLVVAAIVFVSVAWSSLSIGAKAAILLAVTGGIGAMCWWSLGRGLRGSAEAFACVFVVLAGLDFAAAREGGLLGDGLSDDASAWITAAIVIASGAAWARVAVRSRTTMLSGPQALASLGLLWASLLALSENWARTEYVAFAVAAALVVVAFGSARVAVWSLAVGALMVAGAMTATAFVASLDRVLDATTFADLWSTGSAVGWLLCLLGAAAVGAAVRAPLALRQTAAALACVGIALLVLRPLQGSPRDEALAALAAAAVVIALLCVVARSVWRFGARVALAPVAGCVAAVVAPAVAIALERVVVPAFDPWQHDFGQRTHVDRALLDVDSRPVASGLALFATILAVALATRLRLPSPWSIALLATPCAGVALLGRAWPLWGVVVVIAMLALTAGVLALGGRSSAAAWTSGGYIALMLVAAAGSEVTTAVAAAGVCVVLAGLTWFADDALIGRATAAGCVGFAGLAVAAALEAASLTGDATAYALVGIAATAVLGAQARIGGSPLQSREGWEAGAVIVGAAGIALASDDAAIRLPVCLTVAGAPLVAVALLREDRRPAHFAGGALLIAATWSRLLSQDVDVIEAYTLPTAVVLCALGMWRVRTREEASTFTSLAPGLSLALLPSLIATLPDPTSRRALLLGIGAFAVLLAGAVLRWAAPLVLGAATLLVLAVVNVAPYANAVPRWVLFALAGAALLYLGVTWERRLRNARTLIMAVELMR